MASQEEIDKFNELEQACADLTRKVDELRSELGVAPREVAIPIPLGLPCRPLPKELFDMLGIPPPPGASVLPPVKSANAVGLGPDQPGGPPLVVDDDAREETKP